MQPGNALVPQDQEFESGLEDLAASDLKMPRLVVDHDTGTFKDSLSGAAYSTLSVITLGLVKQRVLWQPTLQEGDTSPLCKSTNYKIGYPTTNQPKQEDNFPWRASGWQPSDFQPGEDGRLTLPCETCRLKEWKSHPDGKKTWCSEQHTIPLLYGPEGQEPLMTALLTCQRTSIEASKTYFSAIKRLNQPAFAYVAKISLIGRQRGKNTYYVPVFTMVSQTDVSNWPAYSSSYRSIRDFLVRPPMLRDADDGVDVNNLAQSNVIQGQQAPQQQGFVNSTWAPPAPPPQQWAPAPPPQQQWAPTPPQQQQQWAPAPPPQQQWAPAPPQQQQQWTAPSAPPVAPQPVPPVAPQSAPPTPAQVPTQASPPAQEMLFMPTPQSNMQPWPPEPEPTPQQQIIQPTQAMPPGMSPARDNEELPF